MLHSHSRVWTFSLHTSAWVAGIWYFFLSSKIIQSPQLLSWMLFFLKTKQKLQTFPNTTTQVSTLPVSTITSGQLAAREHIIFRDWNTLNDLVYLIPPNNHTPSAAVLHIHLISSINPVLCFFCRPFGPFLLSGWGPLAHARSRREVDFWFRCSVLCVRAWHLQYSV